MYFFIETYSYHIVMELLSIFIVCTYYTTLYNPLKCVMYHYYVLNGGLS